MVKNEEETSQAKHQGLLHMQNHLKLRSNAVIDDF
jgi:hypothetical protein